MAVSDDPAAAQSPIIAPPPDRDGRDELSPRGRSRAPHHGTDEPREPRGGGSRERERSRSGRDLTGRSRSPPRRSGRAHGHSRSPSPGGHGRERSDYDRSFGDRRYERRSYPSHDERHARHRSRYHDRRSPPRHSHREDRFERRRHTRSRSPSGGRDRRHSDWRSGSDGRGGGGGGGGGIGKKANDKKDLFFDGFQWVSKPAAVAELAAAADMASTAQKERRIHLGNLPLGVGLTTAALSAWVCEQMALHGLQTPGLEGPLVSSCWISPEGGYAFIELRTAAEATASLRLHTQPLHGQPVRVSRPNNYAPAPGTLAPPQPPPLLGAGAALPLAASALAALVPQLAALSGVDLAVQAAAAAARAQPQRAVSLANFVLAAELDDADEREDIARVLAAECAMIGPIDSLLVPAASAAAEQPPKVYVQFVTVADAQAALAKMQARAFDGRVLAAAYVSDAEYAALQAANAARRAPAATAE